MLIVLLTALGVGGATVLGSIFGFIFKSVSRRLEKAITAFSAGVMLSASVFGLIIPALEAGKNSGLAVVVIGIFSGAAFMHCLCKFVVALRPEEQKQNKVLLFVAAIAIHNLPEGIAAGVGFGSGDTTNALMIAGGIALQNFPEGMVIIGPMLAAGITQKKTFIYAILTGLIEIFGTFMGYFTIRFSAAILPFALAYAGGTMLFIICGEMIPDSCCYQKSKISTYCLLAGYCIMLILSEIL